MTTKDLVLDGVGVVTINPDTAQLGAGRSGVVYKAGNYAAKAWFNVDPDMLAKISSLRVRYRQLPSNILSPLGFIRKTPADKPLGFYMSLLPDDVYPIGQLFNSRLRVSLGLTLSDTCSIFLSFHQLLDAAHSQNLLLVDFNRSNAYFHPADFEVYGIDVDNWWEDNNTPGNSIVYTPEFSAPSLIEKNATGIYRPQLSHDWAGYSIMLVNAILGVHPFAGINDHYPNLEDMILHRLWIFDPKVAYPGNGDPKELLEGTELGIALKEIIVDETKKTLPINKLQEYQNSLVTCKCGKQHPRQLSYCPFCQTKPAVVPVSGDVQIFPLLNTISPLVFVAWQSGAVHAVTLGPNEYDYFRVSPRGQVDHQVLFERQKLPSRFAVVGDTHLAVQTSRTDINLYDLKTQSFVSATTSQAYAGNRQLVFRGTSQGLIRLAQGKLLIGTPFHDTLAESILPVDPLENQTYVWAAHDQDVQLVLVQYRQQQLYSLINSGVRYDLKVPQFSTGEALISASVVFAANSCLLVRLTEIGAKKYRRCSILSYDGQVIDVKSIDISQQSLPNIHSHGYSDSGNYYLWIPSDTGLLREDLLTLDRQTILHSRQHVTAADHVTCLGLRSSKYHFLIYNQQHIRYLIS